MSSSYEKYQLKWMMEQGYSLEYLMEELEKVRMSLETSTDGIRSIEDIFDIWKNEVGFKDSSIWISEEEWHDNEKTLSLDEDNELEL
ncbi:hypothetical protein [Thomasclavelia cocleata]|uniref:hypothetical protein n=1 Tax=Thomasclavelia cocleata TaxID=69824 RepID=UPI0024326BDC|nr:hypothetical protein [Thomasclavelia cocleata]